MKVSRLAAVIAACVGLSLPLAAIPAVAGTLVPGGITASDLQNKPTLQFADLSPSLRTVAPLYTNASLFSAFIASGSLKPFQVDQSFDARFPRTFVVNDAMARINDNLTFNNVAFLQWKDSPCIIDVDETASLSTDCSAAPPLHGRGHVSHHVSRNGMASLFPSKLTLLRLRWD